METPNTNPLSGHFRTPALFLDLPSKGEHYSPGALELEEGSTEVAVMPMTARDEIALNTPDSLMNGSATRQVIQSCIPQIKDAAGVPTTDIDSILIAIRIATYGEEMDFTSICPSCKEENKFAIDLRIMLDQKRHIDFSEPHMVKDLKIYFKPQMFSQLNKVSMQTFEEQRLLTLLDNPDNTMDDERKNKLYADYLSNISNLSMDITSNFIDKIVMPDGTEVIDRKHIFEFVTNTDKRSYEMIENILTVFRKQMELNPLNLTCMDCKHEYTAPLEFEASNFFG